MTTNFTQNGTDIDQVLIRQQYASKVPSYKRKLWSGWNGSLWAWGHNTFGQLGQGNITHYSSPVQVGTSSWNSVGLGLHIGAGTLTTGTLFVWGIKGSL